jgi:hypothetical protein
MERRVIWLSLHELQIAAKSSKHILSSTTDLRHIIYMNWQREIGRTYSETQIDCFIASSFGIVSITVKSVDHSIIQLNEKDFNRTVISSKWPFQLHIPVKSRIYLRFHPVSQIIVASAEYGIVSMKKM